MKRAFEKSCQAHFACENTCEKQYTEPCPKGQRFEMSIGDNQRQLLSGWVEEGDACKAPEDFTACGVNRVSFAPMTLSEKQRFERYSCFVLLH